MLERFSGLLANARGRFHFKEDSGLAWQESDDVCALADADRHLGHVIRAGQLWIAYDAMHLNPSGNGFRVIGTFASVGAAKQAIEDNAEISWAWTAAGVTVELPASVSAQHSKVRFAR